MPDGLTMVDGEAMMAFDINHGHPWHRLGKELDGLMSIEDALKYSGSDDDVIPATLFAQGPDGELTEVESHIGIMSDKYGLMGVQSPSYEITQRREMLELAYEITGLSKGDARIDTIGNIGEHGEKFFAYIRVPDVVIDPGGIADVIESGIVVATSFNGKLPNVIGKSWIRVVCSNTLAMALNRLVQGLKIKHTINSEQRMYQAAAGLEYVGAVEKQMVERAEKMLRVKDGDKALERALDGLLPVTDDISKAAQERRRIERGAIRSLYEGEGNTAVDLVGRNGWAAYQAITEWFDHARPVRVKGGSEDMRRAEGAVFPGDAMTNKIKASELVLAA